MNRVFGWMGAVCLVAIIPIKFVRFVDHPTRSLAIGVAPSLFGPAGLLFLLLSSTGRISRLSLLQVTLLVAVFSLALEFMQLLPRPGFLARIHYTFDYYDLGATLVSIVMAYGISAAILRPSRRLDGRR